MSMAHVWLARLRAGAGAANSPDAAAASAAFRRWPRALFGAHKQTSVVCGLCHAAFANAAFAAAFATCGLCQARIGGGLG